MRKIIEVLRLQFEAQLSSRLLERRYSLSGLGEQKDLKAFDWSYNPSLPSRTVMQLATLQFVDAREDVLIIGKPDHAT